MSQMSKDRDFREMLYFVQVALKLNLFDPELR